jgi:hypothetical protein
VFSGANTNINVMPLYFGEWFALLEMYAVKSGIVRMNQTKPMAAPALHADPAALPSAVPDGAETVVISRSRLQELEACELRAELDARNIQLLQE